MSLSRFRATNALEFLSRCFEYSVRIWPKLHSEVNFLLSQVCSPNYLFSLGINSLCSFLIAVTKGQDEVTSEGGVILAHKFRGSRPSWQESVVTTAQCMLSEHEMAACSHGSRQEIRNGRRKSQAQTLKDLPQQPTSKGFTASKAASPGEDKMFKLTSLGAWCDIVDLKCNTLPLLSSLAAPIPYHLLPIIVLPGLLQAPETAQPCQGAIYKATS